jgi:hypothetical protein
MCEKRVVLDEKGKTLDELDMIQDTLDNTPSSE